MSRAIKVLVSIASLLSLGSCVSFFVSSKQEEEFPLWSGGSAEMTSWDWLGIILLALAGAIAISAYRLYNQETEAEKEDHIF